MKEQKNTHTKKRKKTNIGADPVSAQSKDKFNFDNEIVIGVTKIPDQSKDEKTKSKTNKKNSKKTNKKKTNKAKKENEQKVKGRKIKDNNIKKGSNDTSKPKRIKSIIKWTILLSALCASFIFFMMSPLFNLSIVEVINNEKINTDTIISLSELRLGDNIYKSSIKKIENNIKQNAYIENVKIRRSLPNKISITIKERKATYILEYANSYAYINNQGYILEISEQKLEVPIISGYKTPQDEIRVGSRLNTEDLEKLSTVLKIVESANANDIGYLITRIDIQNKQNYTLTLEGEKKIAYLGDASNLSNRLLYLKAVLQEEKGIEGEVFINGDLNKTDVFFRRKN